VVVAKPVLQWLIYRASFDRTTERLYYALVWGNMEGSEGVEGNIGRSLKIVCKWMFS
jgi:hypothetical protein